MFLPKGYVLKLTTIENWLKILMKQGRRLPVYILNCTKERKKLRKFNNCHTKKLSFGQNMQNHITIWF